MAAVLTWTGDDEDPLPATLSTSRRQRGRRTPGQRFELPSELTSSVWRGTELGSTVTKVLSSGFPSLDAELPGAGWPCHSLTEILEPQPTVTEWRLLAPAIRQVVASGLQVVIVGPPKHPHLPGLRFAGRDERHLVWVQAETPSERLWVTKQLVKANSAGLAGFLASPGPPKADSSAPGLRGRMRWPRLPLPPGRGRTRAVGRPFAAPGPLRH